MSDSLSKFSEQDEAMADKRNISFNELLKRGQARTKQEEQVKRQLGPFEQCLYNQELLLKKLELIEIYVSLKPDLIKLKDMHLYYPEFPTSKSMRNKINRGQKPSYIVKENGLYYVVTQQYEKYRRANLGI
ncbi:hypothetical protein MJH12_16940 [bacterium]|nr:hypothetical protein [bacterium]